MSEQESIEEEIQVESEGIWEQFTIADGLPDMKIECIAEDSSYNLWIGTHDRGVVRYDGREFVSFDRSDGLSGDGVFSVLEDANGELWFGTSGGLTRYDGERFHGVESGERSSFLWGGCLDNDGDLWFGLEWVPGAPPAVCRWDGQRADIIELSDRKEHEGQSIHCICSDDRGGILAGGNDLYYSDGEGFSTVDATVRQGNAEQFLRYPDGTIWVLSTAGVFEFRQGALWNVSSNKRINSMCGDAKGNAWFGTGDGELMIFDGSEFKDCSRRNVTFWRGSCSDHRNRIWLGSYGMGLFSYESIRTRLFGAENSSLRRPLSCLAEGERGTILIGSEEGLLEFDGRVLRKEHRIDRHVFGLLSDSQDRLFAGCWQDLYLCSQSNDGAENAKLVANLGIGVVSTLIEDHVGKIWFGSPFGDRFGFYHEGEVELFDEGTRFPVRVGAIEVDSRGRIWIGSANASGEQGVFEYNDGQMFRHRVKLGCPVSALCADPEGLWIGTNQGLKRYDGADVHEFTTRQGLSCDIITCIKESRDGRYLLIGTEGGGVNLYDGKTFTSLQYVANPALNVINDIIEGRCGDLWIATHGGLVQYSLPSEPGNVSITHMTVDRAFVRATEVEVSAETPDIRFEFEAYSEADDSKHLRFRYRLSGYDQDWAQTRDNFVCYSRLPIGEYEFEIQAVDRGLDYSPAVKTKVNVHADPKVAAFNEALKTQVGGEFVGKSASITEVLSQIRDVASNDVTTLIRGETGTGKGLAAKAIHEMSQRADGPFVQVNCGALSEALIDSELFGHERGAFTGAVARKVGKFELADGGTIFLDEIGDLPPASQTRLLHVLQEFTIQRVGGTDLIPIDVRVIAATNRDLSQAIEEGMFRTDLYYRLNVYTIEVPVLRHRKEDIPLLAVHFINHFAAHLDVAESPILPEAMRKLVTYDWPGNVRELEHMMQRAVILTKGEDIRSQHLAIGPVAVSAEQTEETPIEPLHQFESRYLTRVLELTGGVIYGEGGAAALLEVHPNTLRSRLTKLGVKFGRGKDSSDYLMS